jgi:ABC-2 type transport system ATP-binding protein
MVTLPDRAATPVCDQPMLSCRGLHKQFGDRIAVAGVAFEIAAGNAYGLLGRNGAGKTTTLRMICGLLRPDAGMISIAGRPIDAAPLAAKQVIGYVPQEIALHRDLTVRQNLLFWARLHGLASAEARDRLGEALDFVGLADLGRERVGRLSGGTQRRLNLAVALLHRPRLLVLDEPTVGVDTESRADILDGLARLRSEGVAILYTSHYVEEVEKVCDVIGILDRGRLVAEGTRDFLVSSTGADDHIEVVIRGAHEGFISASRRLPSVRAVARTPKGLCITARSGTALLPELFALARGTDVEILSFHVVEADLERAFLQLTGRALHEEP